MTLQNQRRFKAKSVSMDQSIVKESRLIWTPVSTSARQTIPFAIQVTHIELEDNLLFQLGDITEEDGEAFKLKSLPARSYSKKDNVHIEIAYERDLNMYKMEKTAYSLLEMLGDIGGLIDILWIIGAFIVGFF